MRTRRSEYFTKVRHCCRIFGKPDSIKRLFKFLAKAPLDPRFEDFGDFISPAIEGIEVRDDNGVVHYEDGPPIFPDHKNVMSFFGNFYTYSAGFSIYTNDPDLIERLTNAIRANQQSDAYRQARKDRHLPEVGDRVIIDIEKFDHYAPGCAQAMQHKTGVLTKLDMNGLGKCIACVEFDSVLDKWNPSQGDIKSMRLRSCDVRLIGWKPGSWK